jgi:hypothetical protein
VTRVRLSALPIALMLAASACGGADTSTVASSSASTHPRLHDLHDLNQLRTAFNTASNEPRLIVLVSPT